MKRIKPRRLLAGVLIGALLLPQTAVAAPPTVQTDEAVYVNLDYYGVPKTTRIVKGVSLNGLTEFTDYGSYSDVYNMSTYDTPTLEEGQITWSLPGDDRQRFYYECIPSDTETMQMPWNFDVSYKLDGVPTTAEKCAGADGLVEISVHATPNKAASEYYQNNMMLICATGIDMSKMLSIDAPGAQIQSLGTYKLVMFMGLPGEENTFVTRIGSDNFESMGLILFMAPATLSSLDLLADMRDIKDRIGDSGDNLYRGLSDMLTTMQSMQGGLQTMSNGIAGINEVRKQLIASRGTLDPQVDEALSALDALAGQSDSLIPELNSTKTTLTTLNATVNSMLGTLSDTSSNVTDYQKLLRDVNTTLGNLDDLADEINGSTSDAWIHLSDLRREVSALKDNLRSLKSNLESMQTRMAEMEQEIAVLRSVVSGSSQLDENTKALVGLVLTNADSLIQTLKATTSTLQGSVTRLDSLLSTSDSMLDSLEDLDDILDDYDGLPGDAIAEGQRFTVLMQQTLDSLQKMLADIPALSTSLNQLTSDSTSMIDKGTSLMSALTKSLASATALLQSAQDTLRSVRDKSDKSMQVSIDGLLDVLQRASHSGGSSSLQSATDSIHSAIDDGKKDLEEDTNVLNIDSAAALQSVTSPDNPSPASLQFILRTDEISVDEIQQPDDDEPAAVDEGVLARIGNIFKKLFSAIVGVFASEE